MQTLYLLAPSAFLRTVRPTSPCSSSSARVMQICLDALTWFCWVSPGQGGRLTRFAQD